MNGFKEIIDNLKGLFILFSAFTLFYFVCSGAWDCAGYFTEDLGLRPIITLLFILLLGWAYIMYERDKKRNK